MRNHFLSVRWVQKRIDPVAGARIATVILAGLLLTCSEEGATEGGQDSRAAAAPAVTVPREPARARIKSLEVVILSTMLTDRAGMGEWGFAAIVEADGHRLLFDTGHGLKPCCTTCVS
jgi:hypothetical protein